MGLPLPVAEADPIVRQLVELVAQGATDEQLVDVVLGQVAEDRGDRVLAVTVALARHLADPVPFILAPLLDA